MVAFTSIAVHAASFGTGRTTMTGFFAALWLASSVAAGPAFAQALPFNEVGVTMGHWHLNSRDVEANKKLLKTLGGTAIKPGDFEIVRFPGVAVFLHLRPGVAPATGGTEGTVINHLGFMVPNVQEAVGKWKTAGVAVMPGNNERTDQAWITTADGLRIEILEDKDQKIPIRHHHVHFYVPQSAIADMQAWYVKHFGAKAGMRGQFQAADIPGANLTFTKTDASTVPTQGRILDHIGFDVRDLAAIVGKLEAAGIKLDRPVVTQPTGAKLTFIHDARGTSIELNERPNPL
jgi:catechol 2,3-dioxygenase-like lactoylglutathione lyase family enzyme